MSYKFTGMTVSERLYLSRQLMAFENAVRSRNIGRVKTILTSVDMDDDAIAPVLKSYGLT